MEGRIAIGTQGGLEMRLDLGVEGVTTSVESVEERNIPKKSSPQRRTFFAVACNFALRKISESYGTLI
jgi:hypothetical protein